MCGVAWGFVKADSRSFGPIRTHAVANWGEETTVTDQEHNAEQVIAAANDLARQFYRIAGYAVPNGYRFDRAENGRQHMYWLMAKVAYEHILGTDLAEIADELEDATVARREGNE